PAGADAAVAVAGSRILAVGPPDRMVELVNSDTRVIEIEGLVVPGFQDAHIHPPWGGLSELRCALYDLSTEAEYLRAIAAYAAEHPEAAWIEGGGWRMPAFPGGIARKEPLDEIVRDRPVFLENRDGHGAWVNSRALAAAGDGRARRRRHGEDHAGRRLRELHGRDARALPDRRRRLGDQLRRTRSARPGRRATGRARIPGALPRDRGSGRPPGVGRHRA